MKFYTAEHGHNTCDTAAMHLKSHIPNMAAKHKIWVDSPFHIALAANEVKNHSGIVMAPIDREGYVKVDTIKGMRKEFFGFEFTANQEIRCFLRADLPAPAAIYRIVNQLTNQGKRVVQHWHEDQQVGVFPFMVLT